MNLTGSTISFPFRPDVRGTLASIDNRYEIISQAIADLIETRQGERVMMPDYGLPNFLFDVMGPGFAARLAYHLETQILKYVPLVHSVTVKSQTDQNGRAEVAVQYTEVGRINAPQNLVFPVWQYVGVEAI